MHCLHYYIFRSRKNPRKRIKLRSLVITKTEKSDICREWRICYFYIELNRTELYEVAWKILGLYIDSSRASNIGLVTLHMKKEFHSMGKYDDVVRAIVA